SSSYAGSNVLF
nr:immunoglobulin light chain junction region [Macaca mulatta]MPO09563.1 immunoglobulin light chain junction region [Macaca mulatta]